MGAVDFSNVKHLQLNLWGIWDWKSVWLSHIFIPASFVWGTLTFLMADHGVQVSYIHHTYWPCLYAMKVKAACRPCGVMLPTCALSDGSNWKISLTCHLNFSPGDSFSSNFKCSLVLNCRYFLKLLELSGTPPWDEIISVLVHFPNSLVISYHSAIPCLSVCEVLSSSFPLYYGMTSRQFVSSSLLSVFVKYWINAIAFELVIPESSSAVHCLFSVIFLQFSLFQ